MTSSAQAAYQQIADGALPGANDEQRAAARSGQAACLADAADCLLKGVQATPDQQLAEAERAAKEEAVTMLEGAVRGYQQVRLGSLLSLASSIWTLFTHAELSAALHKIWILTLPEGRHIFLKTAM